MKIQALVFLLPFVASAEPLPLLDDLSAWNLANGKPARVSENGWQLTEGILYRAGKAGDLLSKKQYGDFVLSFEWKIASGSNSGVKYKVADYDGKKLGIEYQVIDDGVHKDSKDPLRQSATAYALFPASSEKNLKPVGEWNSARIVVQGSKIEHWLNGALILSYDAASEAFDTAVAKSKFKNVTGFGKNASGHILIQDHNDPVWYRNMTIDATAK